MTKFESYRFRRMQLAHASGQLAVEHHPRRTSRMQKAMLSLARRGEGDACAQPERAQPLFEHALERPETRHHGWLPHRAHRVLAVAERGQALMLAGRASLEREHFTNFKAVEGRRLTVEVEAQRAEQSG